MIEIILAIITISISLVAIVISIIAVNYAYKEYEYKLAPEVTAMTGIRVEAYQTGDDDGHKAYSDEIEILNENNLDKAYLIYPDNNVENLNIDEVEETLEENLNENIKMRNYDLEVGGKFYQYRFLFLTGMEGSYDLYLIYAKTDGEEIIFNGVSGVEIWGLANSNKDNPDYEGEKIMAEQYRKIVEESDNYIR